MLQWSAVMNWIILPVAIGLLAVLLWAEFRDSVAWRLASKPVLSALFILTAFLQPWGAPAFARWVVGGLLLSWVGDVCLIYSARRMFLAGLVAFLLGHVSYAIGFYVHGSMSVESAAGLSVMITVGGVVFLWLRPHLGKMMGPVIAYILVISVMVGGAVAVYSQVAWAVPGRRAVLAGAVLFFLSDLFVARNRFVAPGFVNRLVGLPLYYGGQFLIALSVGLV